MTGRPDPSSGAPGAGAPLSRRALLARTGVAAAGMAAAGLARTAGGTTEAGAATASADGPAVPFFGAHQAGITTPVQARLALAAFDVTAERRSDLVDLLATWTGMAARLTTGRPLTGPGGPDAPPADTGEAQGLGPARLTLTLGYGPSLFDARFGLAARRPAGLEPLPAFPGDALEEARSGGDLIVQVCADDPQVAFHAVHALARAGLGVVQLRWIQTGFGPTSATGRSSTPRNLLGFRDGTRNLDVSDAAAARTHLWAGAGDQAWMAGGTYLVARRIRIHLERWDRSALADQERTIGRTKSSGAPLGASREHDPVDLAAVDSHGVPHIPDGAHIRQAAPDTNHGATLLRRGYSYADGIDPGSGELDAGLVFLCFQRDPRRQFVPIQRRLATQDGLREYLTHTASAVAACPPGPRPDRPWGHELA